MNLLNTINFKYYLILFLILGISFALRAYNLNYNVPFNDEAIYVVVGKLGLFQRDWWSYNASAWMAGYPYVYPPMTALAYQVGGIVGSRLLNIFLFILTIEAIYLFTINLFPSRNKSRHVAGLIAASVLAGSSVSYYVSRLATYDMPSFYFLILSLVFLITAEKTDKNIGKWYFLSAFLLISAFYCKVIIGIFIPFVLIYSYFKMSRLSNKLSHYWKVYYLVPVILGVVTYIVGNFHALTLYTAGQAVRDKASYLAILQILWNNAGYILPFTVLGSIGMLIKKQIKLWALLLFASVLIIVFHLVLHRPQTFDKHAFLAVMFASPIVGIGLSNFISLIKYKPLRYLYIIIICSSLVIYSVLSFKAAQRYNVLWDNSQIVLNKLSSLVHFGDRVLVEVGAAGILSTYENNFPTNVSTFDWFEYKKLIGEQAYIAALHDGYFKYIELERESRPEDGSHGNMHQIIKNNLSDNYKIVFHEKGYVVYERAF